MRMTILFPALSLILAYCSAASIQAGMIVVDNLNESDPSGGGIAGGGVFGATAVATQFTVGSGLWSIDSITLRISELTANNPDQVVLRILSDSGGIPGSTVLGSLAPTSNITTTGNYSFTPQADILLNGGASYWLAGFATIVNSNYAWWVTPSEADNGVLGWSIGTNRYQSPGLVAGPWTFQDDRSGIFRIEATQQVPEPSSIVLFGLGILGTTTAIRRRRRAATLIRT